MVKGILPVVSVVVLTGIVSACGGGGGGSAPAVNNTVDHGVTAPADPWLGSWEHIEGADCEERLTLYGNGEFVQNSADNTQRGVYILTPEADLFLLDLNFQSSNKDADCSGQSTDFSGELHHYKVAVQAKTSIELLTRLMPMSDGSTNENAQVDVKEGDEEDYRLQEVDVHTVWSAVGDQIRSLQDSYVTDYANPYKAKVMANLNRVAFEVTYQYSGYLYPVTTPVLLFNDGQLCRDGRLLVSEFSVQEHRARFPEFWTQWREESGTLQYLQEDGWENAAFDAAAVPFTAGEVAQGSFIKLSGYVIPGTASGTWHFNQYDFFHSGDFASTSGSSTSSGLDFADPASIQVYLDNLPQDQRGHYEFDGYHLSIHYDSGETRHHFAVKDDNNIGKLMWLDGQSYQKSE